MHTATRLAAPVIDRVRGAESAGAHLRVRAVRAAQRRMAAIARRRRCARRRVRSGADATIARDRRAERRAPATSADHARRPRAPALPRLQFLVPDRSGLPPLVAVRDAADAAMARAGSSATPRRAAAASICAAIVRSCPSTTGSSASCSRTSCSPTSPRRWPRAREHITFGDPDFFNGPTHAHAHRRARCTRRIPALTYDVTIKVEHLLQHRDLLPRLRDTGCLFVTSAVESIDDRVLALLEKGHTRADFVEAVGAVPRGRPDAGADLRRLPSRG